MAIRPPFGKKNSTRGTLMDSSSKPLRKMEMRDLNLKKMMDVNPGRQSRQMVLTEQIFKTFMTVLLTLFHIIWGIMTGVGTIIYRALQQKFNNPHKK